MFGRGGLGEGLDRDGCAFGESGGVVEDDGAVVDVAVEGRGQ